MRASLARPVSKTSRFTQGTIRLARHWHFWITFVCRTRFAGVTLDRKRLPILAPTTAELVASFPDIFRSETVRLRELMAVLGDRGLASALLLITLPQLLPLPLGVSNALAIPILLVTVQMAMGRRTLWLPRWLLDRPIHRRNLERARDRVAPLLRRVERIVRPRLAPVWSPTGSQFVGLSGVVIAAVSLTPLPFTGWLPAIALIVIALGMLERDGLVVLLGLAIGGVATAVGVALIAGLVQIGERVQETALIF